MTNKTYQITPEEASAIYARRFRYFVLPFFTLSTVVTIASISVKQGITNQIILVTCGVVIFAGLMIYGMYMLGKKYLATKTMTMKYELTDTEIIQYFPNGRQITASFKDIKKIDQGIMGTIFKISAFKGINILNNRSGHDEILEYVKNKISHEE